MSLIALTTFDTMDFVSTRDSDAVLKKVPNDKNDLTKGMHDEVESWGENASVFKVRSLDVYTMANIYDNASAMTGKQGSTEVGIQTKMNKTNIEAVRFGLLAIPDNFKDKNGKTILFATKKEYVNSKPYDAVTDDVLNSLGLFLIGEIAAKIKEVSEVAEVEEKNFVAAS